MSFRVPKNKFPLSSPTHFSRNLWTAPNGLLLKMAKRRLDEKDTMLNDLLVGYLTATGDLQQSSIPILKFKCGHPGIWAQFNLQRTQHKNIPRILRVRYEDKVKINLFFGEQNSSSFLQLLPTSTKTKFETRGKWLAVNRPDEVKQVWNYLSDHCLLEGEVVKTIDALVRQEK